jgi:hypothetical protein
MGYRSDVKIIVALPTEKAREEVMALYSMHPLVQKGDIAEQWVPHHQTFDRVLYLPNDPMGAARHEVHPTTAYLLVYQDEEVKWYETDEEVKAVMWMFQFLQQLSDESEDFIYAYKFVRVGEDADDIEVERAWSEDSKTMGSALDDFVSEILDVRVEICLDINLEKKC